MKPLKGFENLYTIEEDGTIYNSKTGHIIKARPDKDGYLRVSLWNGDKQFTRFVHRLLAETFIPNPQNLPLINHKDENKTNNSLSNLEWCTHWYNITYSRDKDLALKKGVDYMGEKRNSATTTKRPGAGTSKPVKCIETGQIFSSGKEAAEIMGLDASHISKVCRGKAKSHKGYHFEFVEEGILNEVA